ncbi:MAG: hypothetical protein A3I89_02115 [Candidatus Harrisonbacteria bacterium RIFCSPLOWO2_02_FULL_41_11]|uniref:NodB homology domain-containing protein n=1 Tax=Candidatus Harrisonbacteria bacterium RIFCSPHIGHO2_02_FULL_42_16 TaxID=1798404 RepID=A0A1G1ZHW2_9BACT|nr:MAG: hypothetical protein A3B92_01655 [Candidatus Harrisonbacteria bacterium RIFCSPHIGHO2_02_FULL_42_16]OGY65654.1 MAG: hypothetical protein A3I89_02115 [Candidatus Harrisonbacteria bacterium RIFCSPLOWO2_02_FULL_41_11]
MYYNKLPHGIMFHHFHNEKYIPSRGSISGDDLKKLLEYIGIERFLSPDAWLEKLAKKELKNADICLTFDDGLLSQTEVALPVLEHFKLKAFWFVYSSVFEGKLENMEIYRLFRTRYFKKLDDFYELIFKKVFEAGFLEKAYPAKEKEVVGKLLDSFPMYSLNDARFIYIRNNVLGKENYEKFMDSLLEEFGVDKFELAKHLWMSDNDLHYLNDNGHAIGLHSYSHPTLMAELSYRQQLKEYQENFRHLKKVLGEDPISASHPCDSYNSDTLKVLRELGIRLGFRANMFPKQPGGRLNDSNLEIAREDHSNIMATLKGKK